MQAWWRQRANLHRFVVDLVAGELAQLRRAGATPSGWDEHVRLDADLGADSLEVLQLATALAEALHLHASGLEDHLLARRGMGDWMDIAAAGLEHFSARLTFRTSGSTGRSKACEHTLAALEEEAAHHAESLAGRRRVLCAVPCHHIYGFLFGVLLPSRWGTGEVEFVDLRGSTPAWLARGARPGDLVVGHPEFWAAAARSVSHWPKDVIGITSAAPCPDGVAQSVLAAGLERLVQVYGSSEAAGIAARAAAGGPYELFPFWRFDPSNPGGLLRTLPDGSVQAFAAQDALQRVGERCLHVGGRHDHAVQVGGVNVFPARVRDVLLRHPAVLDVAVRLMRPEEGTRLKAFVVPVPGAPEPSDLLPDLYAWSDRELSVPERPKAIRFGDALPKQETGKPADWSLDA